MIDNLQPTPLLAVKNLTVEIRTSRGRYRAVDDVSYHLGHNEIMGLVGESGSGKTLSALAILGLVPGPQARIISGHIYFEGVDLITVGSKAMRDIRGRRIAMIFQDPTTALNPVFSVGRQVMDALLAHKDGLRKGAARRQAAELLDLVGIADPARRLRDYPHQWSGGMRQRAMIAIAIANRPSVLIADEPTTSLDVTVQAQVMEALEAARRETHAAMILISHDLGLIAQLVDRVIAMYAGQVMESGPVRAIFERPSNPYTAGLLESIPRIGDGTPLSPIPGRPPTLQDRPSGCAFHPRCPLAAGREVCVSNVPRLEPTDSGSWSACHFSSEWIENYSTQHHKPDPVPPPDVPTAPASLQPFVVETRGLTKHYNPSLFSRKAPALRAVDDIDLSIRPGETLGLVGESGSGKTTVARLLVRLVDATVGTVLFEGVNITAAGRAALRQARSNMQIVFQDPHSSLDPRMTIGQIISEPLRIQGRYHEAGGSGRVRELLDLVGLDAAHEHRFPHQFSGGERQRIGIARALANEPKLIILDEPVSSLDVSIQAQILTLLGDLQKQFGMAYLFISHDLSVLYAICDRVAVMYLGKIVEIGPRERVYHHPAHPYTQALLSAVPVPDPSRRDNVRIILKGEVPSATSPPSGCRFRTRCWKAEEICASQEPPLESSSDPSQLVACHFPLH